VEPRDGDRDGVTDPADQCPAVPQGARPDPSRPGCPLDAGERDRDGDTIADRVDACPDQPGVPSRNPRRHGCPRRGRFSVEGSEDWVADPVFFARGRASVRADSRAGLDATLEALRESSEIRRVEVQGHADDTGTEEYNMELSRERAEGVAAWLVAHGIARERIEVRAYGESRPLVPERTVQARAANRRVEVHIVEFAEPSPSRPPPPPPSR
jgi:OmpA-OmpF porin, OOP family